MFELKNSNRKYEELLYDYRELLDDWETLQKEHRLLSDENEYNKDLAAVLLEDLKRYDKVVASVFDLHNQNDENCDHCKVKYPCNTIKKMKNASKKFTRELNNNAKENA